MAEGDGLTGMGVYIETGNAKGKLADMVVLHGAVGVPEPDRFEDVPGDKSLLCVVENAWFDAVAVCYDRAEFLGFKFDGTSRKRTWLLLDKARTRSLVSTVYRKLIV